MDFYLQTGVLLLMMIALSFFIYVFMTPAQLFNNMFASSVSTLNARIEGTVNIDIQVFDNNTALPGTSVMPILRDAGANGLSLFVQTRAQRGMIVNYGVQLRGPNSQTLAIAGSSNSGIGNPTGFEDSFVTNARDLFESDVPRSARNTMGTESFSTMAGTNLYASLKAATAPRGLAAGTFIPSNDPTLSIWDVNMPDYAQALSNGRTYSTTGFFFTPQIRRTNMPVNENTSLASNQGSVFFINQSSMYHTSYIVDQTMTVVGIYIEEHGVDAKGAVLAASMVCEGYINHTLQFTPADVTACN